MTARRVLAAAALLLLLPSWRTNAQKRGKNIDDASLSALQTWVKAVNTHTPGRVDAPVVVVAGFSYETREDLNSGMPLFLTALMGGQYDTGNSKAAEIIVQIGHGAGRDFLKRAAVLHSDVAAYEDLNPVAADVVRTSTPRRARELQIGRGAAPERLAPDDAIPPLLMADRILLDKDGEVVGEVVSTWNWPFARSLLDLLGAGPRNNMRATDPFVSAWYHATTAYMFAQGLYAEATPHLHHASTALADDALAVFDRACYAEILGLPMHQALVADDRVKQRARDAASLPWTAPSAGPELRIPAAAATNAEAERLFRRALAIDPSLVEARVRLGRLLDLRGRHDEAAAELRTALSQDAVPAVAFYARLFAGRAAQAMGDLDAGSRHYREALELFPDAQSALLAASRIALIRADVEAAVAPVGHLGAQSAAFTADPWWRYHLAAGRDADDLLKGLWAAVPR